VTNWLEHAWQAIEDAHKEIPDDATLEQRRKAIKAAYPFGERKYFPYKAWLKVQKKYYRGTD